jgi:hypothetical protein
MIDWLQYAEDHEEKVHIIAHIPPKQCLASFSWNFNQIVNRYENTIAGQFYGHTHNDEIVINYDETDPQRPVSMVCQFCSIRNVLKIDFFLGLYNTIINNFFKSESRLSCL